jgi:hypothetical protein
LGSASSIKAETTTVAASSASEPFPVNRSSRKASAASGGVCREGLEPERTGVAPPLELAAVLAPSTAEATVLKAAPPSRISLVRVRPGARRSESSLTPPSRHPSSAESMAGRFAAWKRAQASFRTRPRSSGRRCCSPRGSRRPARTVSRRTTSRDRDHALPSRPWRAYSSISLYQSLLCLVFASPQASARRAR